jgi:hypothetical protein
MESNKEQIQSNNRTEGFAFSRTGFFILVAGIAMIIAGFYLMSGGASEDPNVFNPELFNTRRITVAPLLIIGGFALNIVAIMIKPKHQ